MFSDPGYSGDTTAKDLLTNYFNSNGAAATEKPAIGGKVLSFQSSSDCGSPWDCLYDDSAWSPEQKATCKVLNNAWFRYKNDFEENQSSKHTNTTGNYYPDVFLGNCDDPGPDGFMSGSTGDSGTDSVTYTCTNPNGPDFVDTVLDGSKRISITKSETSGHVCILTLTSSARSKPIARSFDGYDWELTAGEFSSTLAQPSCDANGLCTIGVLSDLLPDIANDENYVLTSYFHTGFGDDLTKSEAARFLEQVSECN